MLELTKEQTYQLEKNANALRTLAGVGKWAMKPVTAAMGVTSAAVKPVLNLTGKAISGVGQGVATAFDRVGLPLMSGGAKLVGKGAAATAAPVVGAVGEIGRGVGKHIVSPAIGGYSKMLKAKPIQTTLGTGAAFFGGKEILNKGLDRKFTQSAQNLGQYNQYKRQFNKVGNEMKKEAGVLDIAKKFTGYGGTLPSLLGLAALGAIPAIALPSISAAGESVKRWAFPLDSRINAEEEIAKKQLGIATTHQMDQMIGQHSAMGKSFTDIPKLESNLQHYLDTDSLIKEYVTQDPGKESQLRETLNTIYTFAPDIATNRQAAHSILRESAMSPDGGLNYNTIKLITDAQKSISQSR